MSLLLALGLLLLPGSAGSSEALGLPGRNPRQAGPANPLAISVPSHLQEVAPPLAVQQLQEALAERQPRVEILAPATETLLPPGPWTLRLRVHDWPLVDGGQLGLGPHLVVQLDDDEPRPLTSTELTMPSLAPGSHRLTVFAARPWGEAAKNPGAWQQIRLHRAAANPLALPEPGQAQLIAVSPATTAAAEPVLVDWLLLDAPLQNLRSDDASWRLRLSINGDGFVIDRQTPLWLKGWKPGRNAIRFELLDGRGEPLTPPYNSLVREVELSSATPAARWQQGRLSAAELAILLGEAAPATATAAAAAATAAELQTNPEPARVRDPGSPNPAGALPMSASETVSSADPFDSAPGVARPDLASAGRAAAADQNNSPDERERLANPARAAELEQPSGQTRPEQSKRSDRPDPAAEPEPPERGERSERLTSLQAPERPGASASPGIAPSPLASGSALPQSQPLGSDQAAGSTAIPGAPLRPMPQRAAPATAPQGPLANKPAVAAAHPAAAEQSVPRTGQATAADPDPEAVSLSASRAAQPVAPEPAPQPVALALPPALLEAIPAASQRLRPSSAIGSSAREQVNADGTMIKPPRRGPLTGLRERLLP